MQSSIQPSRQPYLSREDVPSVSEVANDKVDSQRRNILQALFATGDGPDSDCESQYAVAEDGWCTRENLIDEVVAWERRYGKASPLNAHTPTELCEYCDSENPVFLRALAQQKLKPAMKVQLGKWRVEYIRLALLFDRFVRSCGTKISDEGEKILEALVDAEGVREEITRIHRQQVQKKRLEARRENMARRKNPDRRRILGLAIDELIRKPDICSGTAVRNAWDYWIEKSRTARQCDGNSFGQNLGRNNLKRRYFPHGVQKDALFKFICDGLQDTTVKTQILSLREQLHTDFGRKRVSLAGAEELCELAEKLRKEVARARGVVKSCRLSAFERLGQAGR